MGNTKNSTSPDSTDSLLSRVRAALCTYIRPGTRVLVGFSGGIDSSVLLGALQELAPSAGISISAFHVNHGISPNASSWADFCAGICEQLGIPFSTVALKVVAARRESLEAAARDARYQALRRAGADVVAVGHHQDDQAETLLLQLLRGAGPRGLAAMPVWQPGSPALFRPLLDVTREQIAAFASARKLSWIDDESNADVGIRRNLLREQITPLLRSSFPGYPETLARSARHCAEAAVLLEDLAAMDLESSQAGIGLSLAALRSLGSPRAKNAIRALLQRNGLPLPSAARLEAWWRQLESARPDARISLSHEVIQLGVAKGQLVLHPAQPQPFECQWQGQSSITLPHGILHFLPNATEGIAVKALQGRAVTVRSRLGGERMRPAGKPHHRSLKNLLQEAGILPWVRDSWPLLFVDGLLAAIPGIATAHDFAAEPSRPAIALRWEANDPR